MDTDELAEAVLEPLAVPTDRLYRMSLDVYHKMTEYGLLTKYDKVELLDGLIVIKPHYVDPGDLPGHMYRFTLDVYHGMAEHGLLTEHDNVVLLDGLLVEKMTRGAPHVTATIKAVRQLSLILPEGWEVRKEDPVTLPAASTSTGRDSEPEPDVAVARGDLHDFAHRHPGPADLALVVEVAESSLREDRAGLAIYAWAKVPVAWIVNLIDDTVEVYTRPTGPADPAKYEDVMVYQKEEQVPVVVDGREVGRIAVADLLP